MTTAPAMVVTDGRVRGQSMLNWSAPGEQNVLRINKTLSVRGWVHEVEREASRESVRMFGRTLRKTTVDGSAIVVNQRSEPVTMVLRVEFSGELLEAEGEPALELRGDGAWRLNPSRLLTWTVDLKAGEKREFSYAYSVLSRP